MIERQIKVCELNVNYKEKEVKSNDDLLVFLHGWGQSLQCFDEIISNLDKNCLSIDMPGFGNSQEPTSDYGVFEYSKFIVSFLKVLNKENKKITIIGHSFGARVAFMLTKSELNIQKMILTGAAGIKPKRTFKYHISVVGYKFQKFLVKTPFYFQYKEDLYSGSGSLDYKNASQVMKQVLIRVVNDDLKYLFSDIKIPVILFWGDQDNATPLCDGEYMRDHIKNSKLIITKGTHYAFLENIVEFIKVIKEEV